MCLCLMLRVGRGGLRHCLVGARKRWDDDGSMMHWSWLSSRLVLCRHRWAAPVEQASIPVHVRVRVQPRCRAGGRVDRHSTQERQREKRKKHHHILLNNRSRNHHHHHRCAPGRGATDSRRDAGDCFRSGPSVALGRTSRGRQYKFYIATLAQPPLSLLRQTPNKPDLSTSRPSFIANLSPGT